MERRFFLSPKSDNVTVAADLDISILNRTVNHSDAKQKGSAKTNDVAGLDIASDDSHTDDFSVTSVTYVLLELILEYDCVRSWTLPKRVPSRRLHRFVLFVLIIQLDF